MKNVLRIGILLASFLPFFAHAADNDIAGSNSYTGSNGIAMPITDLQLTGSTTTSIPVKLLVTNGTLSMPVTAGLTFNGATTTTALYFSGTLANVNAALASLTYTRSGTGSDTLEVSLVNRGEVFFEGTGHLYQYISYLGTWGQANTDAQTKSLYGANGYLATVTSQAENDFVAARLTNAGWMGASDVANEGDWKWVSGPETGTSFWSGGIGGSTVSGRYANWGTGEPNDSGAGEDCAQFLTGGTGKWNDLPCTGTTLPGYVVEFGATGNMPTVSAKNITITTTDAPSISSLTPADNATGVATSSNLTMVFNQSVSTSTGNIIIRKSSDNTIFETIDITTPRLVGAGTIYIINPTNDFAENESYYVTIPNTTFKNVGNAFYAGISASSTWNFTIGDFTAPTISSITHTPGTVTATINWTTNELASSRVFYGLTTDKTMNTTLADVSPRVLSHSVTLSGLVACSTYYYHVFSSDAASNTSTSTTSSFKTGGCIANETALTATSSTITTNSGGSSTLTSTSSSFKVTAPANFTAASTSVVIQIQTLPKENILNTIGNPGGTLNKVGDIVFDVKAIVNGSTVLDTFDAPVTIDHTYSDEDIAGLNESSLWLYHYHGNQWVPLSSCSVNQGTNTISCTTQGFSIFSLYGQPQAKAKSGAASYGSTVLGCKDKSALNYNEFSEHRASLCQYAKVNTQVNTNTASVQTKAGIFGRDLGINMKGDDVKALQQFLNAKGFTVAIKGPGSVGNETTLFGAGTKAALVKYQKSMGIKPSSGYFGPLTRATVN